jgi:iron complex transport system ATP-binding protein
MTHIDAEHVTLQCGDATILSDVSIRFGSTGSTAIIGPNGAGKSMLLKVLAGLIMPTAGSVRVGGEDIAKLSSAARAQAIGYLPQHFQPHWDLTVAELVRLGAERGNLPFGSVRDSVMAKFELTALSERRWSTLSGGEGARVLLAMVLAVNPPLLLADEPGASLDVRHRIDLVQTLVSRSAEGASVVVMHDLDLAFRYFDRVIVVDRGRIVADAAPHDLIEDRQLDAAFGVTFERLPTPYGPLLRAT